MGSLQRQFQRFVPEDVVERLTDSAANLAPERRHVTMLFADLRGFTALCDCLDPAVTVKILNDARLGQPRSVFPLLARKQAARILECRYPMAIGQPRVPADMIDMQKRAKYRVVDWPHGE